MVPPERGVPYEDEPADEVDTPVHGEPTGGCSELVSGVCWSPMLRLDRALRKPPLPALWGPPLTPSLFESPTFIVKVDSFGRDARVGFARLGNVALIAIRSRLIHNFGGRGDLIPVSSVRLGRFLPIGLRDMEGFGIPV